jgi:hypothetical protein
LTEQRFGDLIGSAQAGQTQDGRRPGRFRLRLGDRRAERREDRLRILGMARGERQVASKSREITLRRHRLCVAQVCGGVSQRERQTIERPRKLLRIGLAQVYPSAFPLQVDRRGCARPRPQCDRRDIAGPVRRARRDEHVRPIGRLPGAQEPFVLEVVEDEENRLGKTSEHVRDHLLGGIRAVGQLFEPVDEQ